MVNPYKVLRRVEIGAIETVADLESLCFFQTSPEITLDVSDWDYIKVSAFRFSTSRPKNAPPAGGIAMFNEAVPVLDRLLSSGCTLFVSFPKNGHNFHQIKFSKKHLDVTAWAEVLQSLNIMHGRNGEHFFTKLPMQAKAIHD